MRDWLPSSILKTKSIVPRSVFGTLLGTHAGINVAARAVEIVNGVQVAAQSLGREDVAGGHGQAAFDLVAVPGVDPRQDFVGGEKLVSLERDRADPIADALVDGKPDDLPFRI
jgi:hypothetical protein